MATANTISEIKKTIESNVGKPVRLKANRGRRKTFEKEGILEKVYSDIFTIKVKESQDFVRRLAYSYTDLLTETVELKVL